jgi:glycerol-3-phosphate acyltransferase PlsY
MSYLILICLISYLIGSFPTAYLLVKKFTGQDIRKIGSGNVGAINTLRAIKGAKSAKLAIIGFISVLIIDMAKGALAIFSAKNLIGLISPIGLIGLILAAFFVVLGHNYSIFLRFRGGRGAACLMGILLYLNPISLIVWGLPILLISLIAQVILEKMGREEKINWKNFSDLFSILGKQMIGRMIGLALALIPLYFYNPQIFLPAAGGTILLLIKNIPRLKGYLAGEKIND